MITKTPKRELLLLTLLSSISVGKLQAICDDLCIAYEKPEIVHLREQIEAYWDQLFGAIKAEEVEAPEVELLTEEPEPFVEPLVEDQVEAKPSGVFKRASDRIKLPSLKRK